VVLNLVRNAFDAVRSKDIARPQIRVVTRKGAEATVEVCVADNGPGIGPKDKSFIFDEFYTTKSSGLGLGLSISRSIVEAHGGRLRLSASAETGATFCFTLPASPTATVGV